MKEVFLVYWQALSGRRKKAVWLAVLSCLSGCLEGIALITLIPLLNGALSLSAGKELDFPIFFNSWELNSAQMVQAALGIFLVLGTLSAFVKYVADTSLLRLRSRVEESLRVQMTRVLMEMRWSSFLSYRLGDIGKAMTAEGHQIAYGVAAFVQGVGAVLVSAALFMLALLISFQMTFITMIFILMAASGYRVLGKRAGRYSGSLSPFTTIIGEQVADTFGNLKFFRATGLAPRARLRANRAFREYAEVFYKGQSHGSIMRLLFELCGVILIVVYLGLSILVFQQPFAECLVFLALFYRLAPRVLTANAKLFEARTQISWFLTWRERFDIASAEQDVESGKEIPSNEEPIRLEKVTYAYPSTTKSALDAVTLEIGKKECVAIVGESGSGKSTLVDLITGLLTPEEGQIFLGRTSLRDIDLNAWRSRIGLVLQDSPLFNASVLENIAIEDGPPDLERAKRCACLAHALEFIQGLPQGFYSPLGEKGGRLSGGERQRIALARALYRKPWLLIMDEATSALDSESEGKIQEALEKLKGEFAILMIAHRLKTVQMADKIVVLSHGQIVECGTWEELLSNPEGKFFQMARAQGLVEDAFSESAVVEASSKAL